MVKSYKPSSVEQLAMILAIIRPGKKHLMGKSFDEIAQTVWDKPVSDEYYFKKAHAIAFATAIVVQLNLICENLSQPSWLTEYFYVWFFSWWGFVGWLQDRTVFPRPC